MQESRMMFACYSRPNHLSVCALCNPTASCAPGGGYHAVETAFASSVDLVLESTAPSAHGAMAMWGARAGLVADTWRRSGFPGMSQEIKAMLLIKCAKHGIDHLAYAAARWIAAHAHELRKASSLGGKALWECITNLVESASNPLSLKMLESDILQLQKRYRSRVLKCTSQSENRTNTTA